MTVTYKCPDCGAAMEFDGATQKLKCEYCNHQISVSDYPRVYGGDTSKRESDGNNFENYSNENYSNEYSNESQRGYSKVDMKVYHCQSCGAQLLTDEYTTATMCSFCGNPSMVEDRIAEDVPTLVIPFKVNKNQAISLYNNWIGKSPLLPKELKSAEIIEKISGIYVPYWLYDFHATDYMEANATRTRTQSDRDYRYVYTDHYKITRDTVAEFTKVPADASEKMDDALMHRIEPFNYNEIVKFEMPYLSGYLSEKYNYTAKQLENAPKIKVQDDITKLTRGTIGGYGTVSVINNRVNVVNSREEYALMPVWVLNYRYEEKNYQFMINGQTAKVVADKPPICKKKVFAWGSLFFSITFIILMIGEFLF